MADKESGEDILRAILEKGSDKAKKAAADALTQQPPAPIDPPKIKAQKVKKRTKGLKRALAAKIGNSKYYHDPLTGAIVDEQGQPAPKRIAEQLVKEKVATAATANQPRRARSIPELAKLKEELAGLARLTFGVIKTDNQMIGGANAAFEQFQNILTNFSTRNSELLDAMLQQNANFHEKVIEAITGVKAPTRSSGETKTNSPTSRPKKAKTSRFKKTQSKYQKRVSGMTAAQRSAHGARIESRAAQIAAIRVKANVGTVVKSGLIGAAGGVLAGTSIAAVLGTDKEKPKSNLDAQNERKLGPDGGNTPTQQGQTRVEQETSRTTPSGTPTQQTSPAPGSTPSALPAPTKLPTAPGSTPSALPAPTVIQRQPPTNVPQQTSPAAPSAPPAPAAPPGAPQRTPSAGVDKNKSNTARSGSEQTLLSAAKAAGIQNPTELAQFAAQMAHESGNFRHLQEIWGPTTAQQRYEGRKDLGNVQRGDGYRFRGRGYVQLTGRSNYRSFGSQIGVDLENNPDLASQPEVAAKLAVAYWNTRVKSRVTDFENTRAVTRLINGGLNGLADRETKFKQYKEQKDLGGSSTGSALASNAPGAGTPEKLTAVSAANAANLAASLAPPAPGAPALTTAVGAAQQANLAAASAAGSPTGGAPILAPSIPGAGMKAGDKSGENGKLPPDRLALVGIGQHKAQPVAAEAFKAMRAAATADKVDLGLTDSYRTYQGQVAAKAKWTSLGKPHMAATPGRSNHGWGLAFDMSFGSNRNSPGYKWMVQNAAKFGYKGPLQNPAEAWHWEYVGGGNPELIKSGKTQMADAVPGAPAGAPGAAPTTAVQGAQMANQSAERAIAQGTAPTGGRVVVMNNTRTINNTRIIHDPGDSLPRSNKRNEGFNPLQIVAGAFLGKIMSRSF